MALTRFVNRVHHRVRPFGIVELDQFSMPFLMSNIHSDQFHSLLDEFLARMSEEHLKISENQTN